MSSFQFSEVYYTACGRSGTLQRSPYGNFIAEVSWALPWFHFMNLNQIELCQCNDSVVNRTFISLKEANAWMYNVQESEFLCWFDQTVRKIDLFGRCTPCASENVVEINASINASSRVDERRCIAFSCLLHETPTMMQKYTHSLSCHINSTTPDGKSRQMTGLLRTALFSLGWRKSIARTVGVTRRQPAKGVPRPTRCLL